MVRCEVLAFSHDPKKEAAFHKEFEEYRVGGMTKDKAFDPTVLLTRETFEALLGTLQSNDGSSGEGVIQRRMDACAQLMCHRPLNGEPFSKYRIGQRKSKYYVYRRIYKASGKQKFGDEGWTNDKEVDFALETKLGQNVNFFIAGEWKGLSQVERDAFGVLKGEGAIAKFVKKLVCFVSFHFS